MGGRAAVKVAIHQPHYLPWLGYFAKWAAADRFIFLDTVQYEKNGWQNRNRIKTKDGPRWLTVPVRRAPLGTAVRDVRVDAAQPWRARHLRAIEQAYAAAPHFARHNDVLQSFYHLEWDRLAPLAAASAEWLARALGVQAPVTLASEIAMAPAGAEADPTARLVALCRAVGADTYLAGRDGAAYMDLAQFKAAGIAVEAQCYEHPVYAQLHGEFVPLLSTLDLLLMHGDEALATLRGGNTWERLSP